MKTNVFELKGYITVPGYDEDVFLSDEKPVEGEYVSTYNKASIGAAVKEHFDTLVKPVDVTLDDWTANNYSEYQDVFVQYFVTDEAAEWDTVNENQLAKLAGRLQTEERADGYSEYTVMERWTDIFVGGHDLRKELIDQKGRYAIIRIHYKTA